jgi:hypothetical protein
MKLLPRKKISRSFFWWSHRLADRFGLISRGRPNTAGNAAASTIAATDTDGPRRICHPGESLKGYKSAEAKLCARHYRRRRAAEHQTGAIASRDCPKSAEGEGASVLRQGRRHGGPGQSQRSSRGGRHKKETERLTLQRIGRRSGSRSGPKPMTPDTAIWLNLERFPAATASSVILPARLATPLAYRLLAARDGLQSSLH